MDLSPPRRRATSGKSDSVTTTHDKSHLRLAPTPAQPSTLTLYALPTGSSSRPERRSVDLLAVSPRASLTLGAPTLTALQLQTTAVVTLHVSVARACSRSVESESIETVSAESMRTTGAGSDCRDAHTSTHNASNVGQKRRYQRGANAQSSSRLTRADVTNSSTSTDHGSKKRTDTRKEKKLKPSSKAEGTCAVLSKQ
eukprot:268041-Pleurochrysis_carterae.AAC.1